MTVWRRLRNAIRAVVGLTFAAMGSLVLALAVGVGCVGAVFVMGFHWINEMDD